MDARRLNSSAQFAPETRIVFKISRPARTACVLWEEMSRAAIRIPVLWVAVWEVIGLKQRG